MLNQAGQGTDQATRVPPMAGTLQTGTSVVGGTPIAIVVGVDGGYLDPLRIALLSLSEHVPQGTEVNLFILHHDLSLELQNELSSFTRRLHIHAQLIRVDVRDIAGRVRQVGHLSQTLAQYLRLYIGEMLPGDLQKILYLDCDILVLADIAVLWEQDPGPHIVLAAVDRCQSLENCWSSQFIQQHGFTSDALYFNSGVLLVNLEEWRRQGIGRSCRDAAIHHRTQFKYHDQCALNFVLHGKCGLLDPCWNDHYPARQITSLLKTYEVRLLHDMLTRPGILHFGSTRKPWLSTGLSEPYQTYTRYMREAVPGVKTPLTFNHLLTWISDERERVRRKIVLLRIELLLGRYGSALMTACGLIPLGPLVALMDAGQYPRACSPSRYR